MLNVRCMDRPGILTDLARNAKITNRIHLQKDMAPKRNCHSVKKDLLCRNRSRCKLSRFIKLRIVRETPLGDKRKNPSVLQNCRRVIKLPLPLQRKAGKDQRIQARRCVPDDAQRILRTAKQHILQKEIISRIACHGKLRKCNQLRPVSCGLPKAPDHFLCIRLRVRNRHGRHYRCRLEKSISHLLFPSSPLSLPFFVSAFSPGNNASSHARRSPNGKRGADSSAPSLT